MVKEKAYVNERGDSTIVCKACGRKKTINVLSLKDRYNEIKVKCTCGSAFVIILEKRKYYRKKVKLDGRYEKADPPSERGELLVEDVSGSGLGFWTLRPNQLQVNDIITVTFILDDAKRSVITKKAAVKRLKERFVGAQFLDQEINKALVFYLMP